MLIQYQINDQNYQFIDVRAPREYAEGHIPNAVNLPLFSDEGHERVGTVYKQKGQDEAKRVAMRHVAERLPELYEHFLDIEITAKMKGLTPVIYCARGGMRSKSLQGLFENIGHEVHRLEGGYKAYRQVVLETMEAVCQNQTMIVLHGMTGSGKTQILNQLAQKSWGVLDIEGLARHRGSMLGRIGKAPQLPQKEFEHALLDALLAHKGKCIFVEAESKRLGRNVLPSCLLDAMSRGMHIDIQAPLALRKQILTQEYVFSASAVAEIHEILNEFRKSLSHKVVDALQQNLAEGDYKQVAEVLMLNYYDPKYKHASLGIAYDAVFEIEDVETAVSAIETWLKGDERFEHVY